MKVAGDPAGSRWRWPIPRFWSCLFLVWSAGLLFALLTVLSARPGLTHPVLATLALAPFVLGGAFRGFHLLGLAAERRGWLYYQKPRTGGLGAGVVLDLEAWVSGRQGQTETVRMVRDNLTEGKDEGGGVNGPPS